uniref:Glycosyl transferase family 1 domain-containing protein n=1 Tax=Hemiselmis andersenii TaxID=464988 RepID=A0A6U4RKD1_HEMAN
MSKTSTGVKGLMVFLWCVSVAALLILPANPGQLAKSLSSCTSLRKVDAKSFALCLYDAVAKGPSLLNHLYYKLYPPFPFGSQPEVLMPPPEDWVPSLSAKWFAPFFSGGGYSSEALSFVNYLSKKVTLGVMQHGDSVNEQYLRGMGIQAHKMLSDATRKRLDPKATVEICHSEPGAWSVPTPMYPTSECPTPQGLYSVGRTMFETDRLPEGWAERLNRMDEIWVPARFHVTTFLAGGVDPSKIHIVPEAVDTELFDPEDMDPLEIYDGDHRYKFLSVFKWEERKGWDVLLRAYFSEFSEKDDVLLTIRTYAYHSESNFREQIDAFGRKEFPDKAESGSLPAIHLLTKDMDVDQMPRLYKANDAFVLPSRGEGWGRPHIEAMAMGLPAIATNWSGNTEFMNDWDSYPIPIEGLVPVREGAFKGHLWADPSVPALREIMRHCFQHPSQAREVGRAGMRHVRENYNPDMVGEVVMKHLYRIEGKIRDSVHFAKNRPNEL